MTPMLNRQRGFNIIELLIGLTISLIGLLAVSKIMLDFGKQRNTTAQIVEAQSNGVMALYLIERDLGQAGYGMLPLQNCNSIQWYYNGNQPALSVVPVVIADGGAASDSFLIQYANATTGAPGVDINQAQASFTSGYNVSTTAGFPTGAQLGAGINANAHHLAVANSNNVCTLIELTNTDSINRILYHDIDTVDNTRTPYIPASIPNGANGWKSDAAGTTDGTTNNLAAATGSQLINLGAFVSKQYTVASNNLMVASFPMYTAASQVEGIVFIKAQYGRDTNADGVVDTWSTGTWAINNTNSSEVLAIRVGIVALSPLYEKDLVDAPTSITVLPDTTAGVADNSVSYTVPTTTVNGIANYWQHFRYRTYTTIIPMKNVIWGR